MSGKNFENLTQTNTDTIDINKLANNYSNKQNSQELTTSIPIDIMNDSLITSIKNSKENQIDPTNDRFPCCIVWTPLPFITLALYSVKSRIFF